MMGVIAGHPITVQMTGDASLSRRPMRRVLAPLMQMGLQVLAPGKETLPLTLRGTSDLMPIVYALPVPSAQVKSAVLIAGLHAAGETTVIEREPTRQSPNRTQGWRYPHYREGRRRTRRARYPGSGRPVLGGVPNSRGAHRSGLRHHD
jgi:hypothetical protein